MNLLNDIGRLVSCELPSTDLAAVARSAEVTAEVGSALLGAPAERIVDPLPPPPAPSRYVWAEDNAHNPRTPYERLVAKYLKQL